MPISFYRWLHVVDIVDRRSDRSFLRRKSAETARHRFCLGGYPAGVRSSICRLLFHSTTVSSDPDGDNAFLQLWYPLCFDYPKSECNRYVFWDCADVSTPFIVVAPTGLSGTVQSLSLGITFGLGKRFPCSLELTPFRFGHSSWYRLDRLVVYLHTTGTTSAVLDIRRF